MVYAGHVIGTGLLGLANLLMGRQKILFWLVTPVIAYWILIATAHEEFVLYSGNLLIGTIWSIPHGIVGIVNLSDGNPNLI